MKLHPAIWALLGAVLLSIAGCRMTGDTGVVDSDAESGLLSFAIRDGTTTREEILLLLGAPTVHFEASRLVVHRFYVGQDLMLRPIASQTDEKIPPDRRLYDLVLVFEKDVVCRHRLVRIR